jgi:hypothetical protein
MYGTGEIDIHLQTPIPVHITYQTAFVDDAGKLVIRDDIYGRDARYFAIVKGEERKVADIAVDNRASTNSAATRPPRLPGNYTYAGDGNGMFGWLFGGGPSQRTQYQPYRRQTTYR